MSEIYTSYQGLGHQLSLDNIYTATLHLRSTTKKISITFIRFQPLILNKNIQLQTSPIGPLLETTIIEINSFRFQSLVLNKNI